MRLRGAWVGVVVCAALLSACVGTGAGVKGDEELVAFGPAGMTAPHAKPKRYALVIGIEGFSDDRFGALKYTRRDAQVVAEALGGGFDSVTLLVKPEETTRGAILSELRALQRRALGPRDTLVVYVSSHGTLDRRPGRAMERFVVTSDAKLDSVAQTALSVKRLMREMEATGAKRRALVLAMCHSGRGKSRYSEELTDALAGTKGPQVAPLSAVSEATVVVSASSWGEAAREDSALGHDIYTYYLLEALRRGDRDQDGAVTMSEAHDYARERTYLHSEGRQRPTAEAWMVGIDPIVLKGTRQRRGKPVIYSYSPSSRGIRVEVDGATKGVFPGGVAIEPGPRALRLVGEGSGEVLYEGEVELREGEQRELLAILNQGDRWRPRLSVGLWTPLDASTEALFLPAGVALGAGFEHRPWETSRWVIGADGWWSQGRLTEPAWPALPSDVWSAQAVAHGGWRWSWRGRLDVTPGLGLGGLFARRTFDAEGVQIDSQHLWAAVGQGRLDVAWRLLPWLQIQAHAHPGVLAGELDGAWALEPTLLVGGGAALRF